jgi:16S rRNA G966 N2-methylase RsmD
LLLQKVLKIISNKLAKNKAIINENELLRWRFDVNTFRLLGRELITDRITAVFELVKNCYDANATEVLVDFINVSYKSDTRSIIIKDNGIGMSFKDIKDKWMVVGTNSKRATLYSDPPFNRKFVGENKNGSMLLLTGMNMSNFQLILKQTSYHYSPRLIINISLSQDKKMSKELSLLLIK